MNCDNSLWIYINDQISDFHFSKLTPVSLSMDLYNDKGF